MDDPSDPSQRRARIKFGDVVDARFTVGEIIPKFFDFNTKWTEYPHTCDEDTLTPHSDLDSQLQRFQGDNACKPQHNLVG